MLAVPSFDYYFQLVNLTFLLAPGSVLLIPLALYGRIRADSINVHLLLAAGFMALFVLSWKAALGVYDDWTLFANAAIPVTILAWRNVLDVDVLKAQPGPIAALNLLFLVHSWSWVIANHYL